MENIFIKNKILIKRISDWCAINNENNNIKFNNRDIIDDKTVSFITPFIENIDNENIKYIIDINDTGIKGRMRIKYSNIIDKVIVDKILEELDVKREEEIFLNIVFICSYDINQNINLNLDNFLKNILLFEDRLKEIINSKEDKYYIEGALKEIISNKYERNQEARKKCLDYYGVTCQICGANLGELYGEEFSGKIEVHHIIPLSEIKKTYVVDPIKDLIPVCPNCHMIIHSKKDGIYTPEEIKHILRLIKK